MSDLTLFKASVKAPPQVWTTIVFCAAAGKVKASWIASAPIRQPS